MPESVLPAASAKAPTKRPLAPLAGMRGDTLARLEKAVLELFSSRDFHEVSLQDVARRANVSLQTIYKYFGSKEALVYSMLDTLLGRLAERMIDHLQGIDDARERLRKACWVTPDYMDTVSYTHLRAHETPEHIVCCLLLEKKKKNQL